MLTVLNLFCLFGFFFFFIGFAITCLLEKENRAFWITMAMALTWALLWWIILPGAGVWLNWMVLTATAGAGIVSMICSFPQPYAPRDTSSASQADERDTMFARNNIQHHPDLMAAYYQMRPEYQSIDSQIHSKPEFGSSEQTFHDPLTSPLYRAAFEYLEKTIPPV